MKELTRLDPDGQPHYDPYEILVGHYVNAPSSVKDILTKGYLSHISTNHSFLL